jgi:hypothetical protein
MVYAEIYIFGKAGSQLAKIDGPVCPDFAIKYLILTYLNELSKILIVNFT